MTADEVVGWHHGLDAHDFEQALGVKDREAWWAAVYGVAQSRTRLKRLSSSSSSALGAFVRTREQRQGAMGIMWE